MEKEQIFENSDKAAKFVTGISGWVDRNGRFFGEDEKTARWSGCTHIKCEKCGSIRERNSYCKPCHENKRVEKYMTLEKRDWNGELPIYSDSCDEYFFDEDSLRDYIEEAECTIEDLQLRLCQPLEMNTVDESYLLEDLHEEAELSKEVQCALSDLNKIIMNQAVQTWVPSKFAAVVALSNK